MELFGSIVEIGKNMWEVTGKWLGYVNNLDSNMRNLKRKIDDLSCQEHDINTELISAECSPRKRRKKEVEVWIREVQKIKDEVQRLEHEVIGERKYVSRARLGKLVEEKMQEVGELQERGRFSNGLVIDALPTNRRFIPTISYFCESTSARTIMGKIWAYLMNDNVRRIGVFGMGGVGKTTIMHHINNRLLMETENLDNVIWVTVSKALNIRKMQNEIAKAMDVDLSKYEDETRRASELYMILSKMKRYVLILDDLWEAFPLEKVGISEPTRENGCKIVLTTRSLEVCRKMECTTVKVDLLTEEEGLNLFMRIIVQQIVLDPEVKQLAKRVAKACARLPLAIVTVAGSMRGINDIHEWRIALNELVSSTKGIGNNENEVFQRLKFSYSRLKDEKLKNCFLYCALYQEDYNIPREELIEYWISEGLITEMSSVEAMFDKGHAMLNRLVNTCLLESHHGGYCVRMHDLIRDMALKITSTSPRFMVQAGEGLESIPVENWSKDLEKISLILNKIKVLPIDPPHCPRLTTLLLRYNPICIIPDSFFMHMHCLNLLDLSYTRIKSLPKSISNLENLHVLLVGKCVTLKYVPSLEKLKALKELKLYKTGITEVPLGIEELTNLRNLDLFCTRKLQTFPSWKLRRLTRLQCLRIDKSKAVVSAEDLLCSRQLKVLGAKFHNIKELTGYVKSQQCQRLEKYRLSVGDDHEDIIKGKEVCINDTELFTSGVNTLILPRNVDHLSIKRCHDLISLSDILSLREAKDLRVCRLKHCNRIESIFSLLPVSVETLSLYNLPNVRVLFDGVVPQNQISLNLKTLAIYSCSSIKSIFLTKLMQNLQNLEFLAVSDCKNVEEIIVEAEMGAYGHRQYDSNRITLKKLRRLNLTGLPRLKSIYKGVLVCESLQQIRVIACPILSRLPLSLHVNGEQASAPPALQRIVGGGKWWESLEWDDPRTKTILQPFREKSKLST